MIPTRRVRACRTRSGSPSRFPCGQGFSGSSVASQIITVGAAIGVVFEVTARVQSSSQIHIAVERRPEKNPAKAGESQLGAAAFAGAP